MKETLFLVINLLPEEIQNALREGRSAFP
jgi:hypothetical protein